MKLVISALGASVGVTSCWCFVESVLEGSRKFRKSVQIIICSPALFLLQTSMLVEGNSPSISCGLHSFLGLEKNNDKMIGMLKGLGCSFILMDGLDSKLSDWETKDAAISKIKLYGRSGISLIVFVSETEAERRLCRAQTGVVAQLQLLKMLPEEVLNKLVLVYKPIGISRSRFLPTIIKSYGRIVTAIGRSNIPVLCDVGTAPQNVGMILEAGYDGLFLYGSQWGGCSGALAALYQGAL